MQDVHFRRNWHLSKKMKDECGEVVVPFVKQKKNQTNF